VSRLLLVLTGLFLLGCEARAIFSSQPTPTPLPPDSQIFTATSNDIDLYRFYGSTEEAQRNPPKDGCILVGNKEPWVCPAHLRILKVGNGETRQCVILQIRKGLIWVDKETVDPVCYQRNRS
jgi:hypothetical protein